MRQAIFISFLVLTALCAGAQEHSFIREGNSSFKKDSFKVAQDNYREALNIDPSNLKAHYNLGNANFREKAFDEAINSFKIAAELAENPMDKAGAYHNLGNSLLVGEEPKLEEAIEAYKNALRNNPNDPETRYNLAFARNLLKKQQQEQQKQDGGENKEDQQNKEDQKEGDQDQDQKGDQQKKDGEGEEKKDQNGEKQNQEGDKEEQGEKQGENGEPGNEEGQQAKPGEEKKLSREDAKRLLEALGREEAKVLEKAMKRQASIKKKKLEKDW